ncbi:MAG: hypothetical protein DI616_07250 [Paracoccus denitrificans]|uniref:Uncharacterized protein n=1 Tax=Paracoccus denitrificans TaxID=266 RepID=A0A533ICB1_PARDE|nr:MAG: hypothetical protein DI616_07250 [Paracoccus denitrificans]
MAFTRDKQAKWTMAGAALLSLLALPAGALTPLPACDGVVESGMEVQGAASFGYYGSGFVSEEYYNAMEDDAGADGVYDDLAVSVPQLDGFYGYRVMDCKSGQFLAIGASENEAELLLATEFLRSKAQEEKPITFADVTRAAQALYKGQNTKILTLRETEQTCSCDAYGGQ